jgi:hypothetical protein
MLREIIIPQSDEYMIHIPKEYINTKVEILVLPFAYPKVKEEKETKKDIFSRTAGILSSKNIDPIEWQDKMRAEWDR